MSDCPKNGHGDQKSGHAGRKVVTGVETKPWKLGAGRMFGLNIYVCVKMYIFFSVPPNQAVTLL